MTPSDLIILPIVIVLIVCVLVYAIIFLRILRAIKTKGFPAVLPEFIRFHRKPWSILFSTNYRVGTYYAILGGEYEFAQLAINRMKRFAGSNYIDSLEMLLAAAQGNWDMTSQFIDEVMVIGNMNTAEQNEVQQLQQIVDNRSFNDMANHPLYTVMIDSYKRHNDKILRYAPPLLILMALLFAAVGILSLMMASDT